MSKRVFASVLGLIMLLVLLSACGSQSNSGTGSTGASSEATVQTQASGSSGSSGALPVIRYRNNYTTSDPNDKKVHDYIQQWADQNKDKVNLVQETATGNDMLTVLNIDIAANSVPDAFNLWGSPVKGTAAVKSGYVLDVNKYFAVGANKKEDYDPAIFQRTSINGVQDIIPLEGWSTYWFANKALFDQYNLQIPKTWDELIAVGKVFAQHGIVTYDMGSKGGIPTYDCFSEIYNQLPGAIDDFKRFGTDYHLNNANWTILLNRMAQLRDNGLWPKDTVGTGDWGSYMALYNQGKVAILQGFTWMLKDFNPDMVKNTVKISPIKIPECALDVDQYQRNGCDFGLMLNAKSWEDPAKQKELTALADFIGSEDFLVNKFYMIGELPTRQKYDIDYSKITIPMMDVVLKDKLENRPLGGENFVWFPGGDPATTLRQCLDEFVAGSMDTQTFIKTVNDSLAKAKADASK